MERIERQASTKGPDTWFTGDVWLDPATRGAPPAGLSISAVHFSPGARTAWHSHAGGQTLIVTEGHGLVQARGGEVVGIRAGDVVCAPDGEEHWHGATRQHFMTHLSITGGEPHWGPHLSEDEYPR